MRTFLLSIFVLALAACSPEKSETSSGGADAISDGADTIYTNGMIYTVNEAQPWVEAVAIKDGIFVKVGTNEAVDAMKDEGTEVIDLDGRFAMPGIIDTHVHPSLMFVKRANCGLPGTFYEPTEESTLAALKECIANYPADKEWFVAQGHSPTVMSSDVLSRKYLDELIPDRPAYIEDESGHNVWFNTKAMEAAGVDKNFKDTPEEFFSRTADGDLEGVAYEGAMNPFIAAKPKDTTDDIKSAFTKIMNEMNAKGITSFSDGYVFPENLPAWQELKQEGNITGHLNLYMKGNLGTDELTPVADIVAMYKDYDLPGIMGMKMGMGGALESHSEALIDGYADESKSARPIVDAEKFQAYIQDMDDAGIQVKIHAIGDGSVRASLDGYEAVIKKNGNNRLRHHIDHCSLVHPDDFQRFVDLDVSCTIWPPLNAPVSYNVEGIKPVLKPETWVRMYPNRDMLDSGMRLANHTDGPAAVIWPWWGMEASATRMAPNKPESGSLNPDQALTVKELIKIYTINSAWAMRLEEKTGSIEEGKSAEMIVLNHNLLEIPVTDIHKTEVQTTIFKGKVIYQPTSK